MKSPDMKKSGTCIGCGKKAGGVSFCYGCRRYIHLKCSRHPMISSLPHSPYEHVHRVRRRVKETP